MDPGLAPSGRGHMTRRQIADSVASKALRGQSLAALRKAAAGTRTRARSLTTSAAVSQATASARVLACLAGDAHGRGVPGLSHVDAEG